MTTGRSRGHPTGPNGRSGCQRERWMESRVETRRPGGMPVWSSTFHSDREKNVKVLSKEDLGTHPNPLYTGKNTVRMRMITTFTTIHISCRCYIQISLLLNNIYLFRLKNKLSSICLNMLETSWGLLIATKVYEHCGQILMKSSRWRLWHILR